MGSLFPSDQSGVLALVISMAVLILFGVTLTLVVDGEIAFSKASGGSDADPSADGEGRLAALAAELANLERRVAEQAERGEVSERLRETVRQLMTASIEVEELEAAIETQQEWTARQTERYEAYQLEYRDSIWRGAIGRRFEQLQCRDGKSYVDVVVTEVSAAEVRIRHAHGAAKLPVALLPENLRAELMLDLMESQRLTRKKLEAERTAIEGRRKSALAAVEARSNRRNLSNKAQGTSAQSEVAQGDQLEILTIREKLRGLAGRLTQLESDLSEARTRATGYGTARSAPGSLETWEERVERLSKVKIRAQGQIEQLKGRLREIDPAYQRYMNP